MFRKYKDLYAHFRRAEPGERFLGLYRRYQRQQHGEGQNPVVLTVYIILGLVLFVGGVIVSIMPTPFGFVLVFMGLALIVTHTERGARLLDRLELSARHLIARMRS